MPTEIETKALEWRCVGNGIWEAGHHQVWHQWASDGLWYSSVNVGHRKIERIGDGFKSLEAAQSACQADFTRRILSALSPERKEPVAGWKLVPVEPTEQMLIDAGTMAGWNSEEVWGSADECHIAWWQAMLAATPEQPT